MDDYKTIIIDFINNGVVVDTDAIKLIKDNNLTKKDLLELDVHEKIITAEQIKVFIEFKNKKYTPGMKKQNIQDQSTNQIKKEGSMSKEPNEEITNGDKIPTHQKINYNTSVEIIKNYEFEPRERSVRSFVEYFNARFDSFKKLLLRRPELKNVVSLNRFTKTSQDRDICVIGMVKNIFVSKKNNLLFEIEDKTGTITVFVKDGSNIGESQILLDEVVAFRGGVSKGYFFAETIIWPDIPLRSNTAKVTDPISAVFLSDLHYGSDMFLTAVEQKFINWINSDDVLAKRVKYIFISGDVVDGIGIYPSQEEDLKITDVYKQYAAFEEFVEKLPKHMEIIICPGNHDAIRGAEPQPTFTPKHLPVITSFKNVYLTTNPAYIKIHNLNGQEGLTVLMYHGYSFTSLIDALPHLRVHGITQPQHVMKDVLKRRHLAPLYGATIVAPEKEDGLVIDIVPDIFVTGDLHSHTADIYKGVNIISASTFQGQTAFMDRVGHIANPGKITVLDLDTRKYTILDFWDGADKTKNII